MNKLTANRKSKIENRKSVFAFLLASAFSLPALAQLGPDTDYSQPMYSDPRIVMPAHIKELDPRLKDLWIQAFKHDSAEMRRNAAEAIAQAVSTKLEGAAPAFKGDIPTLRETLVDKDTHPDVRLATARALIALQAKSAAPDLLERAQIDGSDILLLADDALAQWNYTPARKVWLNRLASTDTPRAALLSAMHALAQVQDKDACEPLEKIVLDRQRDYGVRFAAAQNLASLKKSGLESAAVDLLSGSAPTMENRLIAVTLLSTSDSSAAQTLLLKLAEDKESAIVARAVERLIAINPNLIEPLNKQLCANAEPNVRLITATGLLGQKSSAAVALLGQLLDDTNLRVRTAAGNYLVQLDAQESLRPIVRQTCISVLKQSDPQWRNVEQAAHVLGQVHETSVAPRLLELLNARQHGEVRLAAVTALRRLALEETLPPLLKYGEEMAVEWQTLAKQMQETEKTESAKAPAEAKKDKTPPKKDAKGKVVPAAPEASEISKIDIIPPLPPLQAAKLDEQMVQIFEMFGQLKYQPASKLMTQYISKKCGFGIESRVAAIWALGKINSRDTAGKTDVGGLVRSMAQRMNDFNPMEPEAPPVQMMCAVSIGLMKAKDGLSDVNRAMKNDMASEGLVSACHWAIGQITGTPLPPQPPLVDRPTGWFLEPL